MDHGGGAHALLNSIAGPSHAAPGEWDAIFGAQGPAGPMGMPGPQMQGPLPPGLMPGAPAVPTGVTAHLASFFSGPRAGRPVAPPPLPPAMAASLSVADKCKIRDRATILSRHVYADQGEAFADQQVNGLLAALHINPGELPAELHHAHDAEWHNLWGQAQQGGPMVGHDVAAGAAHWEDVWAQRHRVPGVAPTMATGWATEFAGSAALAARNQAQQAAGPAGWAQEFQEQQQPGAWATEFAEEQTPGGAWANEFTQATEAVEGERQRAATSGDAMASTRKLLDVLARDADPKMQASKFLQFVSKMSKGELILDNANNKVVEVGPQAAQAGAQWAQDFSAAEAAAGPSAQGAWADEFARQFSQGLDLGVDEELERAWRAQVAEEAAASGKAGTWAEEFGDFAGGGDEDVFKEWERVYGLGQPHDVLHHPAGPKGQYVFAANNPFLGDDQALAKGKDLFRRGVLSEAALALEAEVQARPNNAEAWRLLGTVHAENDDDQQAIAAMLRALQADPSDADVRLALGVSHTNELDMGEAVGHLATWLTNHAVHGEVARAAGSPPDSSQALSHTVRMFEAAAARAGGAGDAELLVALGVLQHLARQYSPAIASFEAALKLRPGDYSLWNKMGATLANNARSGEAVHAYQRALDLKPNYMRAWTNMGIALANTGDYDKSARFYVRALQLNPSASHVWGYLRTSLVCAGRMELLGMLDEQDVGALGSVLPLE